MNWPLVIGLSLGILLAVVDVLVCRMVVSRAANDTDHAGKILRNGFLARYLLVIAILVLALLIPNVNALWVVVPLIAQKAIWVVWSIIKH